MFSLSLWSILPEQLLLSIPKEHLIYHGEIVPGMRIEDGDVP